MLVNETLDTIICCVSFNLVQWSLPFYPDLLHLEVTSQLMRPLAKFFISLTKNVFYGILVFRFAYLCKTVIWKLTFISREMHQLENWMDAKEIPNITWRIRSFPFLGNFMVKLAAKGYHDRLSLDITEELLSQHQKTKKLTSFCWSIFTNAFWSGRDANLDSLSLSTGGECPALLTRKDTLMVA